MTQILDIAPLRSLVAISERGGFQRAAEALHLSQGAVSHHVRRLETALGRPLFERRGRVSRLTPDGERLLERAHRILAVHDETLALFGIEQETVITIGSTEHAAAQLLPHLAAALDSSIAGVRFRFRIDRGTRLREGLANGSIDMALLLNTEDPHSTYVGDLALRWYSSPRWERPEPLPVAAFDHPCALRTRALETLAEHGINAVIGAEAIQLAGVQAAVGAGLGVALLATLGETPAGLVERFDLPAPRPLSLHVVRRPDVRPDIFAHTADALRSILDSYAPSQHLSLAQGA